MTKLKHVQKSADDLAIPTKYAFCTLRHGTCVALQTQRMETDMLCGAMTKPKQVQKSADDLAIPTK
jgi:hypothetical protein